MKETTAPKDKPADTPARSPIAGPTLADEAAEPPRAEDDARDARNTAEPDEGLPAPLVPTPLPPLGH